jgi:hypothetical protein
MFYRIVTANLDVLSAPRFSILNHTIFLLHIEKSIVAWSFVFAYLFFNVILVDLHSVISGYAKLILECNNAFNYWLPGCELISFDKLLGTFLWQQSAHETVTNEADSSKHASITLLESLLCTRQISSIPALDSRCGVPMEMEAVKTKSHALSPKSDSKLVNKVANQYLKSTTSVGYKKGPYVSSKTSRKCIGPTPSSIVGVGGSAVIDLS